MLVDQTKNISGVTLQSLAFTCAKCSLGICWSVDVCERVGVNGTEEKEAVCANQRSEGGIKQHMPCILPENDASVVLPQIQVSRRCRPFSRWNLIYPELIFIFKETL